MSHRKLIADLFSRKGSLQALFSRRRGSGEAADLVQETYLRVLRRSRNAIEDPEAYLLAVANNLVKENAVMRQRREEHETLTDPHELPESPISFDYDHETDLDALRARLGHVVKQLPARYQLVLDMTYRDGLSQTQIARELNVSRSMVQKILIKAHAHCRSRMIHWQNL